MKRLFLLVFLLSTGARAALPPDPGLLVLEKKLAAEIEAMQNHAVAAETHQKFLQEFRAEFKKAFAVVPPSSENEALRARVLVLLGDHDGAVANLQVALKKQPADPILRVSLGRTRLKENDFPGALAEANAVLERDPNNAAAKFLKAESQGRVAPTGGGGGAASPSSGQASQSVATSGVYSSPVYSPGPKRGPIVGEVPNVQTEHPLSKEGKPLPLWPLAIPMSGALIGYGIYKGQKTTWGENAEFDKATGPTDEQVAVNRRKARVAAASVAVAVTLVYALPRAIRGAPATFAGAKALFDRSGQSFRQVTASEVGAIGPEGSAAMQKLQPLVNADQAVIDVRKLTEYALNPMHPTGENKARVFRSALGFTSEHAEELILQIRKGIASAPASPGIADKFGPRMTVDLLITGPAGQAVVRTGWIYDPGSTAPRLTTIFVK